MARLLREAGDQATLLLERHRFALDQLSHRLLDEETVDGSVVYDVVRDEPSPAT